MVRLRLPPFLMSIALRAVHLQARLFRPLTIGVRAVILDGDNRVFLVKHSYVPGWHCPGGGVEPGETAWRAIVREVSEEANLEVRGAPDLHGVFLNRRVSKRDHVLVYVIRDFLVRGPREPDWEIIELGFFDVADLPDGTTSATRRRLEGILAGQNRGEDW